MCGGFNYTNYLNKKCIIFVKSILYKNLYQINAGLILLFSSVRNSKI